MPTPNVFKSGNTLTNGSIYKGQFTIGVNDSVGFGPTSGTSFWNGISPASGGYTIYQNKAANGPSIRVAANDSALVSTLQVLGSTGSTAANVLDWASQQSNIMVANIDYPSIVTSGMVFNIDAGYVSSYPRQGTTWRDLSGNGINGSLVNGPTYSSADGGSITFDGTNDSVTFSDNSNLRPSVLTANIWAKKNSLSQVQSILFTKRFSAALLPFNSYTINQGPGTGLGYIMGIGTSVDQYLLTTPNINDLLWHCITMTYDGSTIVGYVDGVSFGSTSAPGPIAYSSLDLAIGGSIWGGTNAFRGNISSFSIYNRVLSATEVLQNYNAIKSRYGL